MTASLDEQVRSPVPRVLGPLGWTAPGLPTAEAIGLNPARETSDAQKGHLPFV